VKVKDIMTRDMSAIEADTPVGEFVHILQHTGLSSLPVVDQEDRIVGIISERDIIGALLPGYHETLQGTPFAPNPDERARKLGDLEHEPVGDYMTSPVITLQEHQDDLYAADLIFRNNLKLVPVVNDEGRLSGIVMRIDLLKMLR